MQIFRTGPQTIFDAVFGVKAEVLNPIAQQPSTLPADELAGELKRQTSLIKAEAIDVTRGRVDYARLKDSPVYGQYRQLTEHLAGVNLSTLTQRAGKLAFWLNLYNALVIDGIIHYGIGESVNELAGFFRQVAYVVGGYRFSLDDMEHGILRANAGHVVIPGAQFGKGDPRRAFIIDQVDFRIHAALVCGAVSCPPINFYAAEQIDAQLDLAMGGFLANTLMVDVGRQTVALSKIFQWYGADFGAGRWATLGLGNWGRVLATLVPYLAANQAAELAAISTPKVRFTPYDWALNRA